MKGSIETYNPFQGNRLGIDDCPTLTSANIGDRTVTVLLSNGDAHEFHHQWLRHCCYCESCGNPADGIRFTTVIDVDPNVAPESATIVGRDLELQWPDGHRSTFRNDWLFHHAYDRSATERRRSWRPTTWRCELAESFPTVEWADASDGGSGQLRLYQVLRDYGIVQITGLGKGPEQTEALASLVGPIHETTVYGRLYDVRAEPVAKLGAKTGMAQAPHIDDAFAYSQPGIDVFHCLVNTSEGGLSTYVDGFAVAQSIADDDPRAYELLTSVPISHIRRHPGEMDMRNRGPLISLDEFGHPCGIRYFDRAMAPPDCAAELMDELYDAIRLYNSRMVDPTFMAKIRVEPGNGMLIDNHRVMHGRTAFDPSSGRHIRLCHVPRDEFHARLRELSRTLDPASHDLFLPQGSRNA